MRLRLLDVSGGFTPLAEARPDETEGTRASGGDPGDPADAATAATAAGMS